MLDGKKITGKKAQSLVLNGALLFDTRDPVSFRNGTILGAVNLPLRQVSSVGKHPKNTKIVLFGESDEDPNMKHAVNYLIQMGFTNVNVLGSMENWSK